MELSELQRIILRELYSGRYMGGHNFHSMSGILSSPAHRGKYTPQQFQADLAQLVNEGLVRMQGQDFDIPSYAAYIEIEKRLSRARAALRFLSQNISIAAVIFLLWELTVHVAGHYIYHFLSGH